MLAKKKIQKSTTHYTHLWPIGGPDTFIPDMFIPNSQVVRVALRGRGALRAFQALNKIAGISALLGA
jgi:hypothetical protein